MEDQGLPYDEVHDKYEWVYRDGDAKYILECGINDRHITLRYRSGNEFLDVLAYRSDDFIYTYYDDVVLGLNGSNFLDKGMIDIPSLSQFQDCGYTAPGYTDEEFKRFFSSKFDNLVKVVQSKMLGTIGLDIRRYGFNDK